MFWSWSNHFYPNKLKARRIISRFRKKKYFSLSLKYFHCLRDLGQILLKCLRDALACKISFNQQIHRYPSYLHPTAHQVGQHHHLELNWKRNIKDKTPISLWRVELHQNTSFHYFPFIDWCANTITNIELLEYLSVVSIILLGLATTEMSNGETMGTVIQR